MQDLSGRTNYGRVARLYDWCANVGSLGAIPLVKRLHLRELSPGSSILYVGGGSAEEAMSAAAKGMQVTILDSSEGMLALAKERLNGTGLEQRVTLRHEDFFAFTNSERFDAVAFHFFLDIFDLSTVDRVLRRSKEFLSPSGRVFVSDFSHPNGSLPVRVAQWCYQQGGATACWLMARQPWLQIGDYAAACEQAGLTVIKKRHVGLRLLGKSWFIFLCARPSVPEVERIGEFSPP